MDAGSPAGTSASRTRLPELARTWLAWVLPLALFVSQCVAFLWLATRARYSGLLARAGVAVSITSPHQPVDKLDLEGLLTHPHLGVLVLECMGNDTRSATALRGTCRGARDAVAAHAWHDTRTRIRWPARWRAAFPAAMAGNVSSDYRSPPPMLTNADFVHFRGVRELNMSYCWQATITDAAFAHLRGIHTLNMSGCRQATITDAAFAHLRSIHTLNMRECRQATITDAAFAHLCGIHTLDVRECRQATIAAAVAATTPAAITAGPPTSHVSPPPQPPAATPATAAAVRAEVRARPSSSSAYERKKWAAAQQQVEQQSAATDAAGAAGGGDAEAAAAVCSPSAQRVAEETRKMTAGRRRHFKELAKAHGPGQAWRMARRLVLALLTGVPNLQARRGRPHLTNCGRKGKQRRTARLLRLAGLGTRLKGGDVPPVGTPLLPGDVPPVGSPHT